MEIVRTTGGDARQQPRPTRACTLNSIARAPFNVLVIPEICFAVHFPSGEIRLSSEHDRVEWLDYETARERLTWDSNRVALWELEQRLDAASRARGSSSCEPNTPARDPPAA